VQAAQSRSLLSALARSKREEIGGGTGVDFDGGDTHQQFNGEEGASSASGHVDDAVAELHAIQEEACEDVQELMALETCPFSVRTFVRLDVYTWDVTPSASPHSGRAGGIPSRSSSDHAHAASVAPLRFRRTLRRGPVEDHPVRDGFASSISRYWASKEILIAETTDVDPHPDAAGTTVPGGAQAPKQPHSQTPKPSHAAKPRK